MFVSILHMLLIDFLYLSDGYYLWILNFQHWFWSSDPHRILHFTPHFLHSLDPESDRIKHLLEKYVTYMEETMAGSHGKKAQF